jgi:fatty-acid desaturase
LGRGEKSNPGWKPSWSVNSATHLWGRGKYETPDNSRNNIVVALLACGEVWHNNHRANQGAARHGETWRESRFAR